MISRATQNKIVCYLSKVPFIQKFFTYIYRKFFRKRVEARRAKYFLRNAETVLADFSKCMDSNGFFYTLAFGSMLGAIREKGFIKHDADIDVYMWAEDYSDALHNALINAGFSFTSGFKVDDGELAREETYSKNGIGIDIFFIYPAVASLPYCCCFIPKGDCQNFNISVEHYGGLEPVRIEMPFIKERVLTAFECLQLYVPANAHELLTFRYGEDYMIPKKNWTICSHDDHYVYWKDKLGVYYLSK